MRAFYAWAFLLSQLGIMSALCFGAVFMARIGRKIDREHGEWALLRKHLMHESDKAREAFEAVDHAQADRRKSPNGP